MTRLNLAEEHVLSLGQVVRELLIAEQGSIMRLEVSAESQFLNIAKAVIEAITCHKRRDKLGLNSKIKFLML